MSAEQNDIVVWGCNTPRTFRVYWALHHLGLDYEARPIKPRTNDMERTDFLEISPGKKIPAFEHGPQRLVESGAIVFYLYQKCSKLLPEEQDTAAMMRWSFFSLMELDATALYVMRRHYGLPEIYGEAPVAVQSAIDYFARQIMVVDEHLSDGRAYLVGTALSPADIFLVSCCDWAVAYELALPTYVEAYLDHLHRLKSYQQARKANYV